MPASQRRSQTRAQASRASSSSIDTPSRRSSLCHRRRAARTTASFSMGFNEHVEYTQRPPGGSRIRARIRMLRCLLKSCKASRLFQEDQIWMFLRAVPSPLHGTSTRIRSNATFSAEASSTSAGKFCALARAPQDAGECAFDNCRGRTIQQRWASSSPDNTAPARGRDGVLAASRARSNCTDLLPGAEQRSRQSWSCEGARRRAGTRETSSWNVMRPRRFSRSAHAFFADV
mmetsp:Transcript_80320/g.223641  ORF Transcript_80320/g.223641 Transcript_80320/m.223641 type:complete len:231 (-) Transcript_80320:325-1017(-)